MLQVQNGSAEAWLKRNWNASTSRRCLVRLNLSEEKLLRLKLVEAAAFMDALCAERSLLREDAWTFIRVFTLAKIHSNAMNVEKNSVTRVTSENTIEYTRVNDPTNVQCVTWSLLKRIILMTILELIRARSRSSVKSALKSSPNDLPWKGIWEHILAKRHMNATNVTRSFLTKVLFGDIRLHIRSRSLTNAQNVTRSLVDDLSLVHTWTDIIHKWLKLNFLPFLPNHMDIN